MTASGLAVRTAVRERTVSPSARAADRLANAPFTLSGWSIAMKLNWNMPLLLEKSVALQDWGVVSPSL